MIVKTNNVQCDDKANAVRLRGSDNIVEVLKPVCARVNGRGRAVPDLVVRDSAIRSDLVEAPASLSGRNPRAAREGLLTRYER